MGVALGKQMLYHKRPNADMESLASGVCLLQCLRPGFGGDQGVIPAAFLATERYAIRSL